MASLNSDTQTGYTKSDNGLGTAKGSFFKNPELLAMTFSRLYVKCLFNVALTCKDFLEVALDKIWEAMDSMMPLLEVLPALQVEDNEYVLSGNVSQADWDRLQYYSRRVKSMRIINIDDYKVHPLTYIRIAHLQSPSVTLFPSLRHVYWELSLSERSSHIFLFLSPLLDSLELISIDSFGNTIVGPFLATLSSSPQTLSRIVLRDGPMSVDILKKSFVQFKQLRYVDLSVEVFMSDFSLWEVLGTLPSLANLTLMSTDPTSHPAAPENLHSQSGGPKYFDALECLSVAGSFLFTQHLLDFIDSPCLNSIEIHLIINILLKDDYGPDNLLTPSMIIVASKWSQSLKSLTIDISLSDVVHWHCYAIPKSLSLLMDLHEMQNFMLHGWEMENIDDDVRRMVMSWPKLRHLDLGESQLETTIPLSTLRIIAESCPKLRWMCILLDTSTIPPFDSSSKSLGHDLEDLYVARGGSNTQMSMECQIQIARHLDLIFPNLRLDPDSICMYPDVTWSGIRELVKLCQDIRRGQ